MPPWPMNVKLTKTKTVCIVQKFSGNECIFCVILNSEKTSQNFLDSQALRYLATATDQERKLQTQPDIRV